MMEVRVTPSVCSGSVTIPPSKSMAHRAIICASLADGKSVISNVAYSQDILATIEGMRKLGAVIETKEDQVIIQGIHDFSQLSAPLIDCRESGSTLRFFLPIFSLCNQPVTFQGKGRLLQRPQKVYEEIFRAQGLPFQQDEQGISISSSLKSGDYTLRGNISSQFISGLLFTLPLLPEASVIHILPPFESRSYVELTLQMLNTFGIQAAFQDALTIHIPGKQRYRPQNYTIEGDFSQLAFFAVLAAISNDLLIKGVSSTSKQGDKQILSILKDFQADVEEAENGYRIRKSKLKGCTIDLANCPDLGPILCVLGMYAEGTIHIKHATRLRIKESDRIAAMEEELRKFDVEISSDEDNIYIKGGSSLCKEELFGHNDHRIVMALTIASLCAKNETLIKGAQAIQKSYPNFFEDIRRIHGQVVEV